MKTSFFVITIAAIAMFLPVVAFASCTAPLIGPAGPCFDSFSLSPVPLTEKIIMENYARNIEMNYEDWQMSDRDWSNEDIALDLPAIICTEFVADGIKQYRMAEWVDLHKISNFENHRDDSLCDKWLAPIDDGVKVKWDKPNYHSDGVGVVQVTDKDMNLDDTKIDSFEIHVWSDTDHKGIQLEISETDNDSGIFESKVFFTTTAESKGSRLLVEDAVYAEHKSNVGSSRIINESKTNNNVQRDEIQISFGETVSYENLKFYFYDIEDSRCSSDVTCIWEGNVLAMIRISNATLDIGGSREIGNVSKSFPPYVITLTDIQPHPVSTEKPDYVATLEIEKQKPKPSDFRDLEAGEAISNPEVVIMIQSLGAILIVLFIIIYAIKKRRK